MSGEAKILRLILTILGAAVIAFPAIAQETGPMPPPSTSQANSDKQQNQKSPAQSASPTAAVVPQSAPATTSSVVASTSPSTPGDAATASKHPPANIEVPSGTHIPLVLHNAISTRSTRSGDPVYLETLFPIMADGHVVIPAGSYVSGEVTESKRPGRVKGRGEIMIKLNTLILPNGYMVDLNAMPGGNVGTGGNETADNEGRIKGDTDKAGDAGTIASTTTRGAEIGGLATLSPKGVGIGAGIGAAVGLMAVLLTRGPEAELPRGTTLEAVLNRPLFLEADKVQFTSPGQASTLAGPPNREPVRSRQLPF